LAESLSAERTRRDNVLELVEPWKIVRDNSSTVVPEKNNLFRSYLCNHIVNENSLASFLNLRKYIRISSELTIENAENYQSPGPASKLNLFKHALKTLGQVSRILSGCLS
jgi:hypothetical protein